MDGRRRTRAQPCWWHVEHRGWRMTPRNGGLNPGRYSGVGPNTEVDLARTDIAVVGAGAAGLYAALCAAREGARVVLVSATPLAQTASYWAQGGLAAALAADDSPELHLADTERAGRELVRRSAAEILVHEAPACVADLQSLGVRFDADRFGRLALGPGGWALDPAHRARRRQRDRTARGQTAVGAGGRGSAHTRCSRGPARARAVDERGSGGRSRGDPRPAPRPAPTVQAQAVAAGLRARAPMLRPALAAREWCPRARSCSPRGARRRCGHARPTRPARRASGCCSRTPRARGWRTSSCCSSTRPP